MARKTTRTTRPQAARLIGYARPTQDDPAMSDQVQALMAAGFDEIHRDEEGEELATILRNLAAGDTFGVTRLARLDLSPGDLLATLDRIAGTQAHIVSLAEQIDTRTAGDEFRAHVGHLAAAERDRIAERTRAGLALARARGRTGGRPPVLTADQVEAIRERLRDPQTRVIDICEEYGISRATFYKRIGPVIPDRSGE